MFRKFVSSKRLVGLSHFNRNNTTRFFNTASTPIVNSTQPSITQQDASAPPPPPSSSEAEDDQSKTWTFKRIFSYSCLGVTGVFLFKEFYDCGFNVNLFELSLTERLKRLPLYPPPAWMARVNVIGGRTGASGADASGWTSVSKELLVEDCIKRIISSHTNSSDPHVSSACPPHLLRSFIDWFITRDLQLRIGVTRQDVIDKLTELQLPLNEVSMNQFLKRGSGRVDEERRLSSVGLVGASTALDAACQTNPVQAGTIAQELHEQQERERVESGQQVGVSGSVGSAGGFGLVRGTAQLPIEPEVEMTHEEAVAFEREALARQIADVEQRINEGKALSEAETQRLKDLKAQLKSIKM